MSLAGSAIHTCPCIFSVPTLQGLTAVFEISLHEFLLVFSRTPPRANTGVRFSAGKEDDKSKRLNVYVQLKSRLIG